ERTRAPSGVTVNIGVAPFAVALETTTAGVNAPSSTSEGASGEQAARMTGHHARDRTRSMILLLSERRQGHPGGDVAAGSRRIEAPVRGIERGVRDVPGIEEVLDVDEHSLPADAIRRREMYEAPCIDLTERHRGNGGVRPEAMHDERAG